MTSSTDFYPEFLIHSNQRILDRDDSKMQGEAQQGLEW